MKHQLTFHHEETGADKRDSDVLLELIKAISISFVITLQQKFDPYQHL